MLADVRQATIRTVIERSAATGALVHTDEYDVYGRLEDWGYCHKTVCHARGEYARDDDGDGFCEVHVNTMEGVWSLLRSWLRPHRGVSQEKLRSTSVPSRPWTTRDAAGTSCSAPSSPPWWREGWVLSRSANPQPLQGFAPRRRLWPGPTASSTSMNDAPSSA